MATRNVMCQQKRSTMICKNKIKFICTVIILSFTISIGSAQNQQLNQISEQPTNQDQNVTFKLFPTKNHWTFIKLNTRNGKMWQVHFTVEEGGETGELILNPISLVESSEERNNRFNLYPTENIYNFMLLDQIDGSIYQVQWSMEEQFRGVVPIY